MVFSSPIFLFGFLPLVLLGYLLAGKSGRNVFLLIASLFFYAWGEPVFVLLLLTSIFANYVFALRLSPRDGISSKTTLCAVVSINLGLLCLFKYMPFLAENALLVLGRSGTRIENTPYWLANWPAMPIGISFFTFQALSYVIDVSRGICPAQRNPLKLGLYISMFPQLIAGPIVRYSEIREQIDKRHWSLDAFSEGAMRFTLGLAKKILIADTVARVADIFFSLSPGSLSTPAAWLGVICFAIQIYYDFSGYSDMAIGMGRMFGFRYPENFNQPYIARSVRNFWRRWHMTLSRWFRDYLYIPLGGSRGPSWRVGLNLFVVFSLCGLWHGASWTFLVWGLFHGGFLALERTAFGKALSSWPKVFQHAYLVFVVLISWVLFRCESITDASHYLTVMFTFQAGDPSSSIAMHFGNDALLALLAGTLFCSNVPKSLVAWFRSKVVLPSTFLEGARAASFVALFALTVLSVASNSYSPFLYFRF